MTLNERLVFELKNLLASVDKTEFESLKTLQVESSAFKSVTMRRKLVRTLQEANKAYEDRVTAAFKIVEDAQSEMKKHAEEIDSIEDKDEPAKIAEKAAYGKELDQKLSESLKAGGFDVTYLQKVDKDGNKSLYLRVGSEKEIEVEITGPQKEFIGKVIEAKAISTLVGEDDVIALGELFGV